MAPFRADSSSARAAYDVIPPEKSLQRSAHGQTLRRQRDVEDAEFEVVTGAPKGRSHETINDNSRKADAPAQTRRAHSQPRGQFGMGATAAAMEPAPVMTTRLPQYGLLGLGLAFLLTLGIAAMFNLGAFAVRDGGLVITGVTQSPVDSNGLRVMELTGTVENRSGEPQPLPALIAQMRSDNGAINRSAISLGDGLLAAGETARFTLRIPSPGGKRQEVSISFAPKGV
jgi:hypothetical protein